MNEEKENIQEECAEHMEADVCMERSQQKNRKTFVVYIMALFCVALGLILVSYIMQQHVNSQVEVLGSQLTEQTDAAKGAKAKADQLQSKLDALQEQLNAAEQENETLKQQLTEQEAAQEACAKLIELEQLIEEDTEAAEVLMDEMDTAYTREALTDPQKLPLTGAAAERYAALCEQLGK